MLELQHVEQEVALEPVAAEESVEEENR